MVRLELPRSNVGLDCGPLLSRQVRLGCRLMPRDGRFGVAVRGFLVPLARAQTPSFREAFEQTQLLCIAASAPNVVIAPRLER